MFNRRKLLTTMASTGLVAGAASFMPAWARSADQGNMGLPSLRGNHFDLTIAQTPLRIAGRMAEAITINGTLPAPLLRFREGEKLTLNVTNRLKEDSSIHWHGLLVPFYMDGVPGVAFPGIKPGETFRYEFTLPHNGTYWYHSHSGLQEQLGHYGPLIVDPAGADPVAYDREYVLVLSDWSFEDPHRVFAKLKKMSDTYNFGQRTVSDFMNNVSDMGLSGAIKERAMWGGMRMSPTDISDVTAATYTYLINGHSTQDNWNAIFRPGERVRLRVINAAAMTMFNFRIPGLPMTIVQADGQHTEPLETDEIQIGVAETYDVIVSPPDELAYAVVAESIERSGQAVATLAPRVGMRAPVPALRKRPILTMKDMGMGGHGDMAGMSGSQEMPAMDGGDHSGHDMPAMADDNKPVTHNHPMGPGVANVAQNPVSRLDEPGAGLEDVPHRAFRYTQLRSLEPNPDTRPPEREVEVHLTSNMERYMWSFDGKKFSEVVDPIEFYEGERVRLTMINDTMMPHPIHLHGMFFEVVNGQGNHKPRKHTVTVKPAERLSVDITADHVGNWAFHCHLLFHMEAGMLQVVSVRPRDGSSPDVRKPVMDHDKMDHSKIDHIKMDRGSSNDGGVQ